MPEKLHIARDETEWGTLTDTEAIELLRAGFLLPTDLYWAEGMADWKPLAELKSDPGNRSYPGGWMKLAKRKVVSAGGAAVSQTAKLTSKITSATGVGSARLADATNRMLDSSLPLIQKLVSRQLVEQSMTRVQAAVQDDNFMRKLFGAAYDCLPKPVYRFITEEAFLRFCMERRDEILKTAKGEGDA